MSERLAACERTRRDEQENETAKTGGRNIAIPGERERERGREVERDRKIEKPGAYRQI